jgi:polar amino acid transport system substrate-binding protein
MLRLLAGIGVQGLCGILMLAAVVGTVRPNAAVAQTCGMDYAIKEGETLAQIAARAYGNPAQWTIIFYANQDRLGANVSLLVPGLALRLPCIGAVSPPPVPEVAKAPPPSAKTLAQTPPPSVGATFIISALARRVGLLTADGFAPYTGRSLENGGMLTNVINSAMDLIKDEAKGRFDYAVTWVNDWSAHLRPLLLAGAFDVGFPWARPDCDAVELDEASQFRCQRFFFSEPLYEEITKLFVLTNSPIRTLRGEEMAGTTLCRAAGQPVHELDEQGRNWVKGGKIVLLRPPTVDDCFRLLENGTVHGVVEGELVGRASTTSLGFTDKVRMIEQPLALTTYHVVVSKAHPQARILIYYVNSSLEKLRDTGEYDRIVERHLARFWEAQRVPHPALGVAPAVPQAGAKKDAPAKAETKTDPTKK